MSAWQPEFKPFPKIGRYHRGCTVSEKIDGSNACVIVSDDGSEIAAQSRKKLITPGKVTDNFGFAAWVQDNREELLTLGPGYHYGEWWGYGIQRGYGLPEGDRRFSLFNVHRWGDRPEAANDEIMERPRRPTCCSVVPTLYHGPFVQNEIDACLELLITTGSRAAPFMNPEGIVVFHTATNTLFKVTCVDDEKPKALAA